MWAENVLKDNEIDCNLISVPREISSDCGYCLKIIQSLKERAKILLKEKRVPIDKVVDL
jgi:hypothetical protein